VTVNQKVIDERGYNLKGSSKKPFVSILYCQCAQTRQKIATLMQDVSAEVYAHHA